MTCRERMLHAVLCEPVDRLPFNFVLGPWPETEIRWKKEGMDPTSTWDEGTGLEPGFVIVDVNYGFQPWFEHKVLEERERPRIVRDKSGIVQEELKEGSSIPRYLEYPVKDRDSWEKLKRERLNPHDPARFPADWAEKAKAYNEGEHPVQLGSYPYGMFGTLRDLFGVESLMVAFYDQPDLIHDIMEYLTDFWIVIYEKVCRDVRVDAIHTWEDMSGKTGSLISPNMVREFMLPCYKKTKAFADSHGILVFSLDTDGDCTELVPLFMEAGINYMFPFEVAAGSDVNEYRRLYPKLGMAGGIDKREIAKGKDAIDRELARIIPTLRKTGYIACVDHLIPPDVSWDNYRYFVRRLWEIIVSLDGSYGL